MKDSWLIIAAIVLLIFLVTTQVDMSYSEVLKSINSNYGSYVYQKSNQFGVPYRRVLAIIAQESRGNASAMGPTGDVGLMQITQPAFTDSNNQWGFGYTYDQMTLPMPNIDIGIGFLAILQGEFSGDIDKATQAYNAGAGAVKADPTASIDYLNSVKQIESQII